MSELRPPHRRLRGAAAFLFGYVLALQLMLGALAGASHASQALALGLDPHALCAASLSDSADPAGSDQPPRHDHSLCCTPAAKGAALLFPETFFAVVYAPPSTAAPPSGDEIQERRPLAPVLNQAPRPPPSKLV